MFMFGPVNVMASVLRDIMVHVVMSDMVIYMLCDMSIAIAIDYGYCLWLLFVSIAMASVMARFMPSVLCFWLCQCVWAGFECDYVYG